MQAYISKFAADFFGNIIINGNYQFCFGAGWETEEIDFDVMMSMKLNDCYKVIITDLCDFSSSWKGYNSKYIDQCDLSQDAAIELINWRLRDEYQNFPLLGTVEPDSYSFCYNLPYISKSGAIYESESTISKMAKMAYSTVGNYIEANYKDYLS